MKTSDFKELIVWRESMKLSKEIYILTSDFPNTEMYGLTSQMRRCAISIPSNIAEGHGRRSDAEFSHFLLIARGSATELETQTLIALMLNYISKEKCDFIVQQVRYIQKMIINLISATKQAKDK